MSSISTDDLHTLFKNIGKGKNKATSPVSSDDLLTLFKSLDKSNRGRITVSQLQTLLHGIGIQTTSKDLDKLVGGNDLDYVDFMFFYGAIAKGSDSREDLRKAFKVFDVDGDGFISCEDLQMAKTRMSLLKMKSLEECRNMIRVYDKNCDGVIDFDEFKDMMTSSKCV
ncbi:probable calcium-binding protein CML44 [Salvia hispanica]|uniref:probable calcium-binding protein CML44 n=1 Tax=Salvia hispanica TaxID=49212 RepID=UPI0020092147|nr:probable calcium-binding protein CML44 [Salvia hispanica]